MDLMDAAEFNALVGEIFSVRLATIGFEAFSGHKWVNSDLSEIRKIFTLYSGKGAQLWPKWGFSFDFAPHIGTGEKVNWHRTPKSARYDLAYDPIDYTRDIDRWSISRFGTKKTITEKAQEVANRAISEAENYWKRLSSVSDVPELYEEWRSREYVRFGFNNYVDAPLSYSFALARLGREANAIEWLNFFARSISPATEKVLFEHLKRLSRQDS